MMSDNKISNIKARKNAQKITCLTAYSYPIAKILDQYCDVILVGDSLGMTIYGHKDTTEVTLEMMINHGKAVVKAAKKALIVVDLPFGTYENSPAQALASAQRVMLETGCDAIKIETDATLIDTVKFLTQHHIPVMAHVGLLPQSVQKIGGYKYQGQDHTQAQEILQTSIDIAKAGAFSVVIEAVPAQLADQITKAIDIPTIGIGASKSCDGQVLVIDDLLGLNQEFKPKFVKHYDNQAQKIAVAVKQYCVEVQEGVFPASQHLK